MNTERFIAWLCVTLLAIVAVMWIIVYQKKHEPILLPEVMVDGQSNASHLGGLEQ